MKGSRVAVIAIHGVGDHQPFEMAKAVGDLLEDLEDGPRQPRYCTFGEDWVRLNVAPVKVQGHAFGPGYGPQPLGKRKLRVWGPLDALLSSKHVVRHAAESEPDSLDHLFMEGQLAEYKGEGPTETYETLRLKGRRFATRPAGDEISGESSSAGSGIPEKEVHIYDMFWSDLSGVGTAGLRIFGELYQLLFHLGSVGVNNVNAAAISLRDTGAGAAWTRFAAAQKLVAAILALPIPILNLVMLALAVTVVVVAALAKLSAVEELITTAVLLLAIGAAVWGYKLMRRGHFSTRAFRWPVVLFLLIAAGVSVGAFWNADYLNSRTGWSEAIECGDAPVVLTASLFGVRAVISAYEKRRPGANRAFSYCLAAVVLLAIVSIPRFLPASNAFFAISILLRFIELTFWALIIFWLLFWFAFVWSFVTGRWAVKKTAAEEPGEAVRAARTNWTARLTIAVPATLFLLLTFAGWAGLTSLSLPLLPQDTPSNPSSCAAGSTRTLPTSKGPGVLCYKPLLSPESAAAQPAPTWALNTLFQAGLSYAPALLLLISLAALISIWGLAPSVAGEVSPPVGTGPSFRRKAIALGNWLDHGYRFMRWSGRLLYFGIMAFPLASVLAVALVMLPNTGFIADYQARATPLLETLGTMVAGAGIGILGLGGRLSKLALGFRPIVRVGLDVDNWLREHPRDGNPTARICARYVSLLRFIAQWKDEDGRGYNSLIVFAHSQGTVVTADLFRFLQVESFAKGSYAAYDESLAGLDRMKVYLFTMGCPLRQLYCLRFPYLYGYAPSDEAEDRLPDPAGLGVSQWVNAYRTGDYIGRYLWHHKWAPVEAITFRTWIRRNASPKTYG